MLQFLPPVVLVFSAVLFKKPKLVVTTLVLYVLSVILFVLYQSVILKDMNLVYDFAAPALPCLMFYGVGLLRQKSYQETEKSDTIEA